MTSDHKCKGASGTCKALDEKRAVLLCEDNEAEMPILNGCVQELNFVRLYANLEAISSLCQAEWRILRSLRRFGTHAARGFCGWTSLNLERRDICRIIGSPR
jgi:hypothetical protein